MRILSDLFRLLVLAGTVVRLIVPILARRAAGLPVTDTGVRLRVALERRGLIYRKLGQYLALRADLLPADICAELDRLFESVAPMPLSAVVAAIEDDLGRPMATLFTEFDATPIGSASVAQVHRAVTIDGDELAIKVQRPGIREDFESEVRLFLAISRLADYFRLTGSISLAELFTEE